MGLSAEDIITARELLPGIMAEFSDAVYRMDRSFPWLGLTEHPEYSAARRAIDAYLKAVREELDSVMPKEQLTYS